MNYSEFDYQWKNIPSDLLERNQDRVDEILNKTTLPKDFFKGKVCLDAGCGSGRYTYALQQLEAKVYSIDASQEAIKKCKEINKDAYHINILEIDKSPIKDIRFDFIISFGVLHHMEFPRQGFDKLVSVLKKGGYIYLMLYEKEQQKAYEKAREKTRHMTCEEKHELIKKHFDNVHGWFDAINPKYNHGYTYNEVAAWFVEFEEAQALRHNRNINIIGML
jgi:2-polyprenyl-3-methyl-5-hydroxy-6-metoxy-1,4-benzoquinol methylase